MEKCLFTQSQLSEVAAADLLANAEVGPHHQHPRGGGDGVARPAHAGACARAPGRAARSRRPGAGEMRY